MDPILAASSAALSVCVRHELGG